MRDLGQLLNAHLGCTHRTTEVRHVAGELRFRHGGERYAVAPSLLQLNATTKGAAVFHAAVRELAPGHLGRIPQHITDEEYAGILDG